MPTRLRSRLNDQTFVTLSAVRYGLVRRIGFLFMQLTSCIGGSLPVGAADRAQRVADLLGKIKLARTTTTQKQQSAIDLPNTATILLMRR